MTKSNKIIKTYRIETYGCAMNIADSERFNTILQLYGLKEVASRSKADLLVFNSCSVRQKAEDRIYGLTKIISKIKDNNPNLTIVLTGCMARRKINDNLEKNTKTQKTNTKRAEEIKKRAPWIDIVIETKNFHNLHKQIKSLVLDKKSEQKIFNDLKTGDNFLDIQRTPEHSFSAGITISHGCDHMCSFCIVPYARGREVNRNFNPIFEEFKHAVAFGTKDIMLLGQTVNRWINPKFKDDYLNSDRMVSSIPTLNTSNLCKGDKEPKDFLQLLQTLDQIDGDYWLSFISSHPNYFTKELIDFIANSIKNGRHMRPFIHLALQSGNNEILKRMRRNHTIEEFIEKVQYMKKTIPEVAITTDIIVGFPGETESQFQDTAKVCKLLEFDQIYISEYSQRDGTGSAFMHDDVSHEMKTRRKDKINEILKITALKNNQKLLNTSQKVLVTKKLDQGIYQGRTKHNKIVRVQSNQELTVGEFRDIIITKVIAWALEGVSLQ